MTSGALSVLQLSGLDEQDFTQQLADIFEHSPWVPRRAWACRPFSTIDDLHRCMVGVVDRASHAEQLALIKAHPELAGRQAQQGALTQASAQEQRGAGLDQCSSDELARLQSLNARYMKKFGFPFIIAVKGRDRYQIMDAMQGRLTHTPDVEFRTALNEIAQIARFRLEALLGPSNP